MLYSEIFNTHTAQNFTIIEGEGQPKKIKTQQVIIKKRKVILIQKIQKKNNLLFISHD